MKSVAEDCRLDLLKGLCRRFSHQRRQAFNAEPFSTLIENLDETIGVQNQTVAGCEVNFVGRAGRRYLSETAEYAVLRIE
jgi:hypothetical protein